jgi:hypothetical protein
MKMFDYNPSSRLEERDYAHTNVWTLRAPMLALSHPDPALAFPEGTVLRPQLFVRNALAKPVNITLGFNWHNASASGKTAGPAFRLGPYETRRVDVGALQTANMLPKNANWACVVLTTSGLPDEVVAVAASYDETLRVHQRDQFSGTWGRNLQPPVKMRVFRQSGLLPICPRIASTACARSHTKQNQGASLRNFKIGEVAFRAGPYKQGRRALRIAKLHIFDDQTRLRCPMGEQPRLCPVNHDRTDILRWGS